MFILLIQSLLYSLDQALAPFHILIQCHKPFWMFVHSYELNGDPALLERCQFTDQLCLVQLVSNQINLVHPLEVVVTDRLGFKVVRASVLTSEPLTLLV